MQPFILFFRHIGLNLMKKNLLIQEKVVPLHADYYQKG